MARTPGAKNKGKVQGVKLADILRVFTPDTVIPVETTWAKIINDSLTQGISTPVSPANTNATIPTNTPGSPPVPVVDNSIKVVDLTDFRVNDL